MWQSRTVALYCFTLIILSLIAPAAQEKKKGKVFDHSRWGKVLKEHVSGAWVDYTAIKKAPADLNAYLSQLAKADLRKLDRNEKIAIYINAYNAFTVKLITEYYPDIDSIKDIPDGLLRPRRWKDKRWDIGGEKHSLLRIEPNILRAEYKEPRVHFALNCASIGCPNLREEPYEGGELDEQLDSATREFNRSRKGLRLDRRKRIVHLSSIYDWYEDDFEKPVGSVLRYVARYVGKEDAKFIRDNEKQLKVRYLHYDWKLNDVRNKAR